MSIRFSKDTAAGKVLMNWWEGLENDTGGRALLRRAPNVTAAILTPAYQRLHQRLLAVGWPPDASSWQNDRLAAVAALLAHVSASDDRPIAESLSQKDPDADRANVSESRFMRVLQSPDFDSLYTSLRRVLPLLHHKVNVYALANDVLYWGDETKKRWAYAYEWPEKSGH
jgi:CRISPR system Cascade subunit CasB